MKIVIHQPQYLPYIGFFHKVLHADIYVVLDDVGYFKGDFTYRNKIKTSKGWMWIIIPIHRDAELIKEVKIDTTHHWRKKHWKSIKFNYTSSAFFSEYEEELRNIYEKEWDYLVDIDTALLKKVFNWLDIKIKIVFSSDLNVIGEKTSRLINICKELDADEYISGLGGREYLDEKLFADEGIKLSYQKFKHPIYPQLYGEFIPNLSIIDLIFNCGAEESIKILNNI